MSSLCKTSVLKRTIPPAKIDGNIVCMKLIYCLKLIMMDLKYERVVPSFNIECIEVNITNV